VLRPRLESILGRCERVDEDRVRQPMQGEQCKNTATKLTKKTFTHLFFLCRISLLVKQSKEITNSIIGILN